MVVEMTPYFDAKGPSRSWHEPSQLANEITSLRKSGQLKAAFDLARYHYFQGNREDSFMQAYLWVLYDCLKRYLDPQSRFHNDIRAYCSTLSQLRRFPIDSTRDELFIENLCKHVCTVGWGLRRQQKIEDTKILCTEICRWQRNSVLYTSEIAKMLLVATKPYDEAAAPVLQWLGIGYVPWSYITLGRLRVTISDDIAACALSWAFYDDLKRFAGDEDCNNADVNQFVGVLSAIRSTLPVKFGENEAVVLAVKKLVHMGWEFHKNKNIRGIETLLIEATSWDRASVMHGENVLKVFAVSLKERPRDIVRLVDWYGLSGLSEEFFQPGEYKGKPMPSMAEDLAKRYVDGLMSADASGQPIASIQQKLSGSNAAANLLQDPRCKEWDWARYSLGKLYVETEKFDAARDLLAPILAMKLSEPWAWFEYGKTWISESPEKYEACLFRGLSVAKDPGYAKKLHEAAATCFADKELYGHAKAEVLLLKSVSEASGWRQSSVVATIEAAEWYETTEATSDIESVYRERAQGAEELVAGSLPWIEFYVDKVIPDKGVTHIVLGDTSVGSRFVPHRMAIKNRGVANDVEEGLFYRGHLYETRKALIGAVEECPDSTLAEHFVSTYSGELDLVKNFGFVNDCGRRIWVSPTILGEASAHQFQQASGKCRLTFKVRKDNPSGGEWAWTAMTLKLGAEAAPESYRREGSGVFRYAVDRYDMRRNYGFVADDHTGEEYYVPVSMINQYQLFDCSSILFVAEKAWDSKKGCWGWKVTEIEEGASSEEGGEPL